MSRIPNWADMTPAEQEKTKRLIGKRNQARMAALKEQQQKDEQVEGCSNPSTWMIETWIPNPNPNPNTNLKL